MKINNRFFILFISLIIMMFIAIYLMGCNQPEPPKLVLSEESWNYGEVAPDKKLSHQFNIKNEGGEKLIIESVYSSCACVVTDLSAKEIAPGKETELTATFDPYGYEGEVSKFITIKSNDPEEPEKKIELTIHVLHVPNPDMTVSQQTFYLGEIDRLSQEKPTIQFTIYNSGDADLIIEDIVIEDIFSHNLNIPLTILPGEKFLVELNVDTNQLSEGEFRKSVRLMSNDLQKQVVFLRIQGKIR